MNSVSLRSLIAIVLTAATTAWSADITVSNKVLFVTLRDDSTLVVRDQRTGQTWAQQRLAHDVTLKEARLDKGIRLTLRHAANSLDVVAELKLERDQPEFTVTLSAKGAMTKPLAFPHPFASNAGISLLLPLNEGIGWPVDDASIRPPMRHDCSLLSMPFCALTDGERGCMAIIETPDDAAFRLDRLDGNLCFVPEWAGQKGRFAYPRRVRYVFFDRGGHVAICKRYRHYARQHGLLKTLEEKRRANPSVDRLVGAMNVWGWNKEALPIAREMRALGMERIMWSTVIFGEHELSPETVRAMNDMGFLTARYDNYQEVMDPARFDVVKEQATWVTAAWPHDRLFGAGGKRPETWFVKGRDGQRYGCVVVCDSQAQKYARQRIPEQLKTLPYRARFVDTITAARTRECYDPAHLMTHSDSRRHRMELLRYVSEEQKLVTGSENGRDVAVPYVHYFEGMLSLQPYRIPEEGRKPFDIWRGPAPEPVTKFGLSPRYRLPLWELVFHDCVVSHWWWGDCNTSAPAIRELRDLWNILYGTPPLVHVNPQRWATDKNQLAEIYRRVCPVARAVGYAEMTDHRFLTPDRSVQQTKFSNGVTVTVNFGDAPHRLHEGITVPARGFHVAGLRPRPGS